MSAASAAADVGDDIGTQIWREVVDVELPTFGQLVSELADEAGIPPDEADEIVEGAIDNGTLTKNGESTFGPTYEVATVGFDHMAEPIYVRVNTTEIKIETDGAETWTDVDFSAVEPDVWPPAWEGRRFWMGRKGKQPFAPWGDRDNPDAPCTKDEHDAEWCDECSCDARYKWSIPDNWADKVTVDEWVEKDPLLDGHAVILEKENEPYTDDPDPYALVDGDNVRCPETDEIHPGFIEVLDRLGMTYADVSTSGTGAHALYEGQLPGGTKQVPFDLDDEPWGENDEVPGIEIYDGKRVCVITGDHVKGSAGDVRPWDGDELEAIIDEHTDVEDRHDSHDTHREVPELEDYTPTATRGEEITADIRDVFAAVDRLDAGDLPLETQQVCTDGTGWEKWDPSTYRTSSGNDSLHTANQVKWFDQKTGHSFGLLGLFAAEQGIITRPWHDFGGATFWRVVDRARGAGANIPIYVPEAGTENAGGETYDQTPLWALRKAAVALDIVDPDEFVEREGDDDGGTYPGFPDASAYNETLAALDDAGIDHGREPIIGGSGSGRAPGPRQFCETCEPPITAHADPLDVDARREEMLGEAYDRFLETDDLTLYAYNPGEGKTTNGTDGAAVRERPFVVALPKHENCREFQKDEMKPDGCFHLKGAAQPIGDECMDAQIDERDCNDHGHGSECPSMCPVYDLDSDHPKRVLFDVFAAAGKSRRAHEILGLYDEPWHGDSCAWLDQWDAIENVDWIVTVHQYLQLKSIREHGDILIDDIAGGFVADETVTIDDLSRCRQALRKYARYAKEGDGERVGDTLRLLAIFTDDLLGELAGGATDLRDLEAPTFPETTRTYETREAIPDHVDEADVTKTRTKQYVGEGGQYNYKEGFEVVTTDLAETLAQARHFYEESVITAMKHDDWGGTPLCLDTVLGALAAALDDEADASAARVAVEAAVTLDTCPRCSSRLQARDGARMCDDCGWHEDYDRLTQDHTPSARIDVDVATTEDGEVVGLVDRRLPSTNSLPDPGDVLILDATPQTAVYAAVFGVDPESVHVEGDDAYALPNVTVTQFTNGAYHLSTLEDSSVARAKIQQSLEKVSTIHDDVVYVSLKKIAPMFDWPETSVEDVMNYYSLRGLDAAKDADAIVLVGAPHPNEDDLRAEGRLLALDNPGVRAGGRELSTRTDNRDDPDDNPGEPIYRKLNYVDDDGKGRAMAAKRYSGITGDLFDARHEDELVQAAHRIRPLLADTTDHKYIYMFTNVPTKLPVDRVTTFDDFLDPLGGALDVRDSALDLLHAMVDAARDEENDAAYVTDGGLMNVAGTVPEWVDASERAGMDVSRRTVRRGLDDLREAGLIEEGDYIQHRGRLHTLTSSGASVASVSRGK